MLSSLDQRRCWGYLLAILAFFWLCPLFCKAPWLVCMKWSSHVTHFHFYKSSLTSFSKLNMYLMSCPFSYQRHAKIIQNSHVSEKFARILRQRFHYMGLSRLVTWLLVIFLVLHAPPCIQKLGDGIGQSYTLFGYTPSASTCKSEPCFEQR